MNIPHIDHAYENIKNACDARLKSIYPIKVPSLVSERYEQELKYLKNSDFIDSFEIYRLLSEEAKKCAQYFSLRGTDAGSYIVYLLGNSLLNPLPTHYYCPHCGYFETVKTKLFGIDLPEKICPECNSILSSDGFNLSIENAWGLNGKNIFSFDYNVSEEFMPFAKRLLKKIYPNNEIVPFGMLQRNKDNSNVYMKHSGFLILPLGRNMQDYPELHSYLDDGELCISTNLNVIKEYSMHRVLLFPAVTIDYLIAMQRRTGLYINDISYNDLRTLIWNDIVNTSAINKTSIALFRHLKPKTFTNMTALDACSHSTYSNIEPSPDGTSYMSLVKMMESPEFTEYPCYTRDDVFDALLELSFDNDNAFEISKFIRMGKATLDSPANIEKFEEFNLPDNLKKVAKQCRYLFPRAHCVQYLLNSALLAYYMKQDSRSFSRIITKK